MGSATVQRVKCLQLPAASAAPCWSCDSWKMRLVPACCSQSHCLRLCLLRQGRGLISQAPQGQPAAAAGACRHDKRHAHTDGVPRTTSPALQLLHSSPQGRQAGPGPSGRVSEFVLCHILTGSCAQLHDGCQQEVLDELRRTLGTVGEPEFQYDCNYIGSFMGWPELSPPEEAAEPAEPAARQNGLQVRDLVSNPANF